MIKKGNEITLDITGFAFEGKGIAKVARYEGDEKNYVIFVSGSYPGDTVKARLHKVKKSFAEARTLEVLSPSYLRTEPECVYFGTCGGCKHQDLQYENQLKFKEDQVRETFEHIAGLTDFDFEPILPSENIFRYRNKMEFSFSDKKWITREEFDSDEELKKPLFAVGLHIPRIYDKVLDLEYCKLQSETGDHVLNFTRKFFLNKNIPAWSTKTHEGFLRNLVIKNAGRTKDFMVNLVTSSFEASLMAEYSEKLIKECPGVSTIVNSINSGKAQVARGEFEEVLFGEGYIYDWIGDYKFRISAGSFFQTNTLQAERLYNTALEFAGLKAEETVYDLYSGAGTITIYLSGLADKLYGFESVNSAVEDAKENARINDITNTKFYEANLDKSFLPLIKETGIDLPDVIIADPPRSGMNPKTVSDILKLLPDRIVYVSCNPSTQARDIKLLCEEKYKLVKTRPVDMFPHTWHIENVALLKRI